VGWDRRHRRSGRMRTLFALLVAGMALAASGNIAAVATADTDAPPPIPPLPTSEQQLVPADGESTASRSRSSSFGPDRRAVRRARRRRAGYPGARYTQMFMRDKSMADRPPQAAL